MNITTLDHIVLTVADIDATCAFYCDILGMERQVTQGDRVAVAFGTQKINLHLLGHEIKPNAATAVPGSSDLCFLTDTPAEDIAEAFRSAGVEIVNGPVERLGAQGRIRSVYVRDPDGNLVEIGTPLE